MTYLFLAIPNFCGSTLIHDLVNTSNNVVALTFPKNHPLEYSGCIEGNNAVTAECYKNELGGDGVDFGLRGIEANSERIFSNPNNYDWKMIKTLWDANWESSNTTAQIRLQKRPTDIFCIPAIMSEFVNVKWILSVRNPYSYVETLTRDAEFHKEPLKFIDRICYHVLRVMELQSQNLEFLGNAAYVMTYEDFCMRPEYHIDNWYKFMPELSNIDMNKIDQINDVSNERLDAFFTKYAHIKDDINKYFIPFEHILNQWGYEIQ